MNLQQIKEAINKTGFSNEALTQLNNILDNAISRGFLNQEEKIKMLSIIDLEMEANDVEADALEDVSLSLKSFANDIDEIEETAQTELDSIEENFKPVG